MSLPHALLTALIEQPGSGAELAERFDRSIGHYWCASHQQIYRELAWMEREGWISSAPAPGQGRKRVHAIEPSGRSELERWLGGSMTAQSLRVEVMVRIRAAAVLGTSSVADELLKLEREHAQKLGQFEELKKRAPAKGALDREAALKALLLQAGIDYEMLLIKLARDARAVMQCDSSGL